MLVNLFSVSQLILKIYAWAVPKMPNFGENSDIWLRYWLSKLKSRFLPPSFSRPTSISKWVGAPDYVLHGGCILHFAQDLREKFSARCVLVGQAACDPANCILAASSNQQAAIKADALHLSIQLDQNDTFRAFQSMQCSVMWK